jgi:nucleoside-diphosphate-sugar epimerase
MRVLVTGGAGYLGSTLVPRLLADGHDVTVLDRFFFGEDTLPGSGAGTRLTTVRADVRWCDGKVLEGHDAVVDMAALSNDPAGALDPWKTYEINYLGRARIARLAKEAKVSRYLATSSCSVYGFQDGWLTETSVPRPLTAYARANILVEKDNLPLGDDAFTTTAVRFATLYGLSPRMRFDLAINGMVSGALRTGKIPVMRDGKQWRPFLHVKDAAAAIVQLLEADPVSINRQVFNVGSEEQNFQIQPLAQLVSGAMQEPPSLEWYGDPDARSYRVNFSKVQSTIHFAPKLGPADAVREVESALRSGATSPSPRTSTVGWYQHLLQDPVDGAQVALHGTVL